MTTYQRCVEAAKITAIDRRFLERHFEDCPVCLECSDHARCRVTNCATLDAITELMVEQAYPAERGAVIAEQFERDGEMWRRMRTSDRSEP